jgi:hypothetical protein
MAGIGATAAASGAPATAASATDDASNKPGRARLTAARAWAADLVEIVKAGWAHAHAGAGSA